MNYSQFVMAVFAVYVVYYTANFLYDPFLKQGKTNTDEKEIPHKVVDEDFETGSYEKEKKKRI